VLTDVFRKLFGTEQDRQVKKMIPLVREVRSYESEMVRMTNHQLRAQTGKFKEKLSQGASLDDILPEAFATCCEAAKRVCGMRLFDVQVIGGVVLHRGGIAEMMTGEGKTLVATLPIYLNALTGKGVHLVTVNDYLARRDREWMGPIYESLGLTVGLIQHDMRIDEKQAAYRADVTYATNNELGFDYLRDNMARNRGHLMQRGLNFAIVDEIDSILIDEARTPLIISGRPEKSTELYQKVDGVVRQLRAGEHYELEEKGNHVLLNEDGMSKAEELLGVENLYTNDSLGIVHMVEQALKAHNFFKKDQEYVVRDNQVLIVDEFTGRIQEGRRFSDGLHQALEAKEGVPVQFEMQTIASVTYQNFFNIYDKLAGMTGTAVTEAAEFDKIYNLEVFQVPTNLPMQRADLNDLIYGTEAGKLSGVVKHIAELHESGRPVLVGTRSIEMSERLSKMLSKAGVDDHEVLNAKYHGREASIVANAGKRGAITIATNMAGRGTDIKLGEGVRELGGLAIVGTERHESRRIDNQLRGRCGRQGDPGTTQFFLSLEDEVARLFGGDKVKRWLAMVGSEDQMDDEPLNMKMLSRSIERAQRQWEEYNSEIRKHVKEYDDVMNVQRKEVYGMRRAVLMDEDVRERILTFFENQIYDACELYTPDDLLPEEWDLDGLETRFRQLFSIEPRLSPPEEGEAKPIAEDLIEQAQAEYTRREEAASARLRELYEEQVGRDIEQVDFTKLARKFFHDYEKRALLSAVDDKWIEHLYSMDYLRESVRLRAYGQRDPLVEYKTEGFAAFQHMIQSIEETVIQALFRVTDPNAGVLARGGPQLQSEEAPQDDPLQRLQEYHMVGAEQAADQSFAAADTSRFQLGGQRTQAPASSAAGAAVAEEEEPQSKGNRAQRRAAARRNKKSRKSGKKRS